jgi:hypothetical protein
MRLTRTRKLVRAPWLRELEAADELLMVSTMPPIRSLRADSSSIALATSAEESATWRIAPLAYTPHGGVSRFRPMRCLATSVAQSSTPAARCPSGPV